MIKIRSNLELSKNLLNVNCISFENGALQKIDQSGPDPEILSLDGLYTLFEQKRTKSLFRSTTNISIKWL